MRWFGKPEEKNSESKQLSNKKNEPDNEQVIFVVRHGRRAEVNNRRQVNASGKQASRILSYVDV